MLIASRILRPAKENFLPLQCLAAVVILFASGGTALGQLRQQSFDLTTGWNSIFLEVNAFPDDADTIFSGQPISAVWMRAPEPLSGIGGQCSGPEDLNCQPPDDTMWRVWFPPGPGASIVTTLRVIRGGNVYQILASAPTTLTITGMPSGFDPRYRPGFNNRGMYVKDTGAPTVAAYLQPESRLDSSAVYEINAAGAVVLVPGETQAVAGKGYWIPADGDFTYNGPLDIDVATRRGVDFGRVQLRHEAVMANLGSLAVDVTTTYLSSLSTIPTGFAGYAGDVPLYWLEIADGSTAAEMLQWNALGSDTFSLDPAGLSTPVFTRDIGVRRTGLAVATVDIERQGSLYQGFLEVSTADGFRRLIALSTEVGGFGGSVASAGGSTDRPGLYFGTVRMDRVAWVSAGARIWTNQDAGNPQFAGLLQCSGGVNDGETCVVGRSRCMGTPEADLMSLVCDGGFTEATCTTDDDCLLGGTCTGGFCTCPALTTCEPDCPGGDCRGFCIGGDNADGPCNDSVDCAGAANGTCSADLNSTDYRPVTFELEFPVILHLSNAGEYKMLTEVALLQTPEGLLVLATPDCPSEVCDSLDGAMTVNGQPFARRIATAAFSFEDDFSFDPGGNFTSALAGTIIIAPNHPLNPFRHKFHPDHDCLDRFGEPLQGNALDSECFQVTRVLSFAFDPTPPDGRSVLDWGDSVLGGTFTDSVDGLHKETIRGAGRFELHRVSTIGELNTPVDLGGTP